MSKEGVQNHLKHGGPQVTAHETSLTLRNASSEGGNARKASIWEELGGGSDGMLIQDGGTGDDIVQESSFADFAFDSSGQLTLVDSPRDPISGIMVGNLLNANSGDWSNKAEQFVTGGETTTAESLLDDSAKGSGRDLGDLFATEVVDIRPEVFSLSDALPGKLTCHSSPVSPINFLEETTGRSRSYSDTENDEKIATKAFLDELERGSQLTAEEQELMELSRNELRAYEFQVLDERPRDKSNTLLTAQELENLPGLEFDESGTSRVKVEQSKEESKIKVEPSAATDDDDAADGDLLDSEEIVKSSMSFISMTTTEDLPNQESATWNSESVRNMTTAPTTAAATITTTQSTNPARAAKTSRTKPPGKVNRKTQPKKPGVQVLASDPPTISIPETTALVNGGPHGMFEVDASELIPVQLVSTGVHPSNDSAAADNSTQQAINNLQLSAFPMLYMKDGCLVIPIQQLQPITPAGSSAASAETAIAVASVATSSSPDAAADHLQPSATLQPPGGNVICSVKPPGGSTTAALKPAAVGQNNNVKKAKSSATPRTKVAEDRDKWPCTICSASFPRLYKLRLHTMKHTGEKPFKCNYPGCKWAFTTAFKLKRHSECHLGKKDFVCEVSGCGRQFTTVYNLNTHKKSHMRRLTEECKTCGEKFSTQRQLDYHMRAMRHGEKELTYECPHKGCGRKFFSRYCMGSHMRVHLHTQKFMCPEEGCGRLFDKHCRLQQHLRSHTGEKPYKCTHGPCSAAFATQSKLKRHARKHTGERRWVCDIEGCGKAFLRAEHLRAHRITHTGEKPFECKIPECNARFKCKSSLYVHLKRHAENAKKAEDPNSAGKPQRGSKYSNKAALNMRNNYNRQLQNALGDLFTLINAEELESLITSQVDQQMSTVAGDVTGGGATVVGEASTGVGGGANTGEMLSVSMDGHPTLISDIPPTTTYITPDSGLPVTTTTLLTPGAPAFTSGGPAPQTAIFNTTPANISVVQERGATTAGSIINLAQVPTSASRVTLKNSATAGRLLLKNRNLVANPVVRAEGGRAKRKKVHQTGSVKPDPTASLRGSGQITSAARVATPASPAVTITSSSSDTVAVNPNEIVTSRAITFRDPETGTIYVQTQLLQDDPPEPDLYPTDPLGGPPQIILDSHEPPGLASDLPSILLGGAGGGDMVQDSLAAFTGTTINLQDLE